MDNETERKETITSAPTFFSAWRPLLGWVSIGALTLQFIVIPIVEIGLTIAGHPVTLPRLDFGPLISLITGVLGLGGLRTIEKVTGTSNNH